MIQAEKALASDRAPAGQAPSVVAEPGLGSSSDHDAEGSDVTRDEA